MQHIMKDSIVILLCCLYSTKHHFVLNKSGQFITAWWVEIIVTIFSDIQPFCSTRCSQMLASAHHNFRCRNYQQMQKVLSITRDWTENSVRRVRLPIWMPHTNNTITRPQLNWAASISLMVLAILSTNVISWYDSGVWNRIFWSQIWHTYRTLIGYFLLMLNRLYWRTSTASNQFIACHCWNGNAATIATIDTYSIKHWESL